MNRQPRASASTPPCASLSISPLARVWRPRRLPLAALVAALAACSRAAPPPAAPASAGANEASPAAGALASAAAGGALEDAPSEQEESPALLRAREIISFLNSANASAIEAFVTSQFGQGLQNAVPMPAHERLLRETWERHPELTLRSAREAGDGALLVHAQSEANDSWLFLRLEVASVPPNRIEGLRLIPASGPPSPALEEMDPGAVTAEQRRALVESIHTLLVARYVLPDVGEAAGRRLIEAERAGEYADLSELGALSERMTRDLQEAANDRHLRVIDVRQPPTGKNMLPPPGPTDFGYAESKLLDNGVGYVELRFFAPAEVAREASARAMRAVDGATALIFDLRRNGGGSPSGVQLLSSYLFAPKTHLNSLYWREGDHLQEFWTLDEVDGEKRPDVPVFVLTSQFTFSGAEEFAYNLQTRKRATIVGETTGGGANPGGTFRLAPGLLMFVSLGRAVNPITNTNWEGVGVQPDVRVAADDALDEALKLARKKARRPKK